MKLKRLLYLIVLFLMVGMILSACGASGASPRGSSNPTPIPLPPTPSTTQTASGTEEDAWQKIQCGDVQSLQDFVTAFPDGVYTANINLYISIYKRMDEIKAGSVKSALVIPFADLGDRWQDWMKRQPGKGGIGYFLTESSMGIFFIPGCRTISMDNYGSPVTSTGDGSIAAFRTDGLDLEFLNSILIQSAPGDILHFGVIDGMGLVYLRGSGKVTLPNGSVVNLP